MQDTRLPDPVPSQITTPEVSIAIVEKEPTQMKGHISRPLSPYFIYKDLKPQSSPTLAPPPSSKPTPDTTLGSTKAVELDALEATLEVVDMKLPLSPISTSPGDATIQINVAQLETSTTTAATKVSVEVPKTRPLSPYDVYEDLKQPTSPSPFHATSKVRITNVTLLVEAAPPSMETSSMVVATPTEVTEKEVSPIKTKERTHLSPYHVYDYDDLKPPTSPSPSVPTVSFSSQPKISGVQDTSTAETPKLDKPVVEISTNEPKPRPLSPFTICRS